MTTHWTPSVGETIAGRYEIRDEFGKGGIAQVWQAYDTQESRTVAIKHILFDSENYKRSSDTMESLFDREIESLKKIRDAGGHPNIIDLYDIVTQNGTTLVVVEPVEGEELEDVSLTQNEARQVAIELADAMGFLHKNEIIYRDLKPDNAMLKSDGSPVLIDFNTAKEVEKDRQAGQYCPQCGEEVDTWERVCPDCGKQFGQGGDTKIEGGSNSPYKPPETAKSLEHMQQGPWSDVYSLGKILHFLLIDNDRSTVPPPPDRGPQDFGVDCPDYTDEVIRRGTKKNTDERYNNAQVFKLVLKNRDPEPPARAELRQLETDETYDIEPGDTVGRKGAAGPDATITLERDDSYVSAVQVQFSVDQNNNWILQDRSLNGTYVQRGGGWQRVLCEQGRKRLKKKGESPTDRHGDIPPEQVQLGREAVVALVNPQYDVTFEFKSKL